MNRELAKTLADAAVDAIQKKLDDRNYQARWTRANIGSNGMCTFTIEVSAITEAGIALTREASDLLRFARTLGLPENALGLEFDYGRERFQLVGFKPKSTKYPFLAKKLSDSKVYKLPEFIVIGAAGGR